MSKIDLTLGKRAYRVSYRCENPGPAGPFRGKMTRQRTAKPQRGDRIRTPFGAAIVTKVST
jgi:hypothetical protein